VQEEEHRRKNKILVRNQRLQWR